MRTRRAGALTATSRTPTLRLSVLPDAIPSAEMVFQPLSVALPQSVGPDAIASAELVYAPLVTFAAPGAYPGSIPSVAWVYDPLVTLEPRWCPPDARPSSGRLSACPQLKAPMSKTAAQRFMTTSAHCTAGSAENLHLGPGGLEPV